MSSSSAVAELRIPLKDDMRLLLQHRPDWQMLSGSTEAPGILPQLSRKHH
jgi:hypothetical protein